jgi:hypothetical protein
MWAVLARAFTPWPSAMAPTPASWPAMTFRNSDSDLDLLVTVPDDWLAAYSRLMETDALGCKLAHDRIFSSMTAGLPDHVGRLLP